MIIKYIVVSALALTILSACSQDSSSNTTPSNTTASLKVDQSTPPTEVATNAIQVGKD